MLILKEPATTILMIFFIAFFGYLLGRIKICGISLSTSAVFLVGLVFVPFFLGFLFSRKILKLPLLNGLGAMTASMTCTPSLAALIQTAGTDDVVAAYATTYPIAMINMVVLVQLLARIAR